MTDRALVYPTEGIQDSHILFTNKHAMMGLGYALQAILGSTTQVDGLACTPTTPASLAVNVATGSIYTQAAIDATAYGTIAADTVNQIVKQGISLGSTPFTITPPATSGKSQVYLIQAAYQDQDAGSSSQPFVATDGSQSFSTVNTVRKGVCVLGLKAGTIANTGSQATPSPDAGYTGLYAITVANGATTITSGNIVRVAGAPFLDNKLASLAPINSPAFTGSPTAPTPSLSDLSTLIATTAFVKNLSTGLLAANGWQRFPSGLILQWGQGTTAGGGIASVVFPITFPTALFRVTLGLISGSPVNAVLGYSNQTTSGMNIFTNATPGGGVQLANVDYFAIGY